MPDVEGGGPPPHAQIMSLVMGKWITVALSAAARLGIADLLADGPKHVDEIARANQMDANALFRVLRALASVGVFQELSDRPRTFGLTPTAELLRSGVPGSMRAFATMMTDEWNWASWGDFLLTLKTGEPAFDRVFGMNIFDYFAKNPGPAATFDEAMAGGSGAAIAALLDSYDFSEIETLADVGGGHGHLLCAVLKKYPRMKGLLADLPNVLETSAVKIAEAGLSDRVTLAPGSFFDAIPRGANAYLFKHIIHDWDLPHIRTILANCRAAMRPEDRLLILEMIVPDGNAPSPAKFLDLEMMAVPGGMERTEAEYRALLLEDGFETRRVIATNSPVSVIEAYPVA